MDNQQKDPVRPDEMSFNDCDRAYDILSDLKAMSGIIHIFATEAGSESLATLIKKMMEETIVAQRGLFDLMYMKGWYPLQAEDAQKIQQAYTKNENIAIQLKR